MSFVTYIGKCASTPGSNVQCKEGIDLHNRKVVVENQPEWENPDILRSLQKVGDQFDKTGNKQPADVRYGNVPCR